MSTLTPPAQRGSRTLSKALRRVRMMFKEECVVPRGDNPAQGDDISNASVDGGRLACRVRT